MTNQLVEPKKYDPLDQPVKGNIRLWELPRNFATLTAQDFGFDGPLAEYAARYNDDPAVKKTVDNFLEAFIALMKADLKLMIVVDDYGQPAKEADGRIKRRMLSEWVPQENHQVQVNRGNPRCKADFWEKYVRKHWLEALEHIKFFDPVPDQDPDSPRTEKAMERAMNPKNVLRRKALDFLASLAPAGKNAAKATENEPGNEFGAEPFAETGKSKRGAK